MFIADMQMPEMDGWRLARTLGERGGEVPMLALTAPAVAEDRERCLDAGGDGYLSKPIDKALLRNRCERWIDEAASRQTAGTRKG